ncbi:MAG TPA: hypothetical protein VKK79_05380 [Candidatus Lokiarchaeia archaeon]|nr:hypothetical protein [Candidatus Lokiarchaeia archaeon]
MAAPDLPAGVPAEFYLTATAIEYFTGVVVSIFLALSIRRYHDRHARLSGIMVLTCAGGGTITKNIT